MKRWCNQDKRNKDMLVELEYKAMSLFIATGDGMMRRQVFAEMDDARALRLLREYGYDPAHVFAIVHETFVVDHEVDDSEVAAVLDRMPYHECRSSEEMLDAVRCIVPRAKRIVRLHGGRRKWSKDIVSK